MARPLMQHGVGQLEQMYKDAASDRKVLLQLQDELKHRQVPRAVTLLAQVQRSIRALSVPASDTTAPPPSPAPPPTPTPQPRDALTLDPRGPGAQLSLGEMGGESPPTIRTVQAPLSMAEACKILKVAPTAEWGEIELARRELVQRASPLIAPGKSAEERAAQLVEVRRINHAYASIFDHRCKHVA